MALPSLPDRLVIFVTMKINLFVKTGQKIQKIEKMDNYPSDNHLETYKIWVKSEPVDGKANSEIVKLLSIEFRIPRRLIKITSGFTSNRKIVLIDQSHWA